MTPNQTEHDIAANNLLFGLTHFLTLALPADWRITRSYLHPDVQCNVRRGEVAWVEAGQTDQIVYHPLRKIALDLTIVIKRGKRGEFKSKGVEVHSRGSLMINGHEASYFLGEIGLGFFKRKLAKKLCLSFYCSELGRTIMISFTGTCQEDDLREIFGYLSDLKCH